MSDRILLAVDLGTTNCKAVAYTLDGSVRASGSVSYPTSNPREGWYEQHLSDWRHALWDALVSVAEALGSERSSVAGLCLSAWGPGLVLLGPDGTALNDTSPTWQDTRSLEHGKRLVEAVGPEWVGGGMPLTGFPAKLAWAIDEWPALTAAAAVAIGVKDYLLLWLTGSIGTDPSSGPYSAAWPRRVFDLLHWDEDQLPPVVPPTAVLGHLRGELAEQLDLPPGTPVLCGVNDGAAATMGVGAHRVGDAVVSLGTNGVLRLLTPSPPTADVCLSRSLFRYPITDAIWACGGFVLTGGGALAWIADATAGDSSSATLGALLAEAEEIPPGSDGLVFLPYLVGKGSPEPDPEAAGALVGLRIRHRRGHLVRSVVEGVAFAVREIAEELRRQGFSLERLLLTGGGAASPLWRSIFADVLKMPANHVVGDATLGSAALLAVGLGFEPDIPSALVRLHRTEDVIQPLADRIEAYDTGYRAYQAAEARAQGARH